MTQDHYHVGACPTHISTNDYCWIEPKTDGGTYSLTVNNGYDAARIKKTLDWLAELHTIFDQATAEFRTAQSESRTADYSHIGGYQAGDEKVRYDTSGTTTSYTGMSRRIYINPIAGNKGFWQYSTELNAAYDDIDNKDYLSLTDEEKQAEKDRLYLILNSRQTDACDYKSPIYDTDGTTVLRPYTGIPTGYQDYGDDEQKGVEIIFHSSYIALHELCEQNQLTPGIRWEQEASEFNIRYSGDSSRTTYYILDSADPFWAITPRQTQPTVVRDPVRVNERNNQNNNGSSLSPARTTSSGTTYPEGYDEKQEQRKLEQRALNCYREVGNLGYNCFEGWIDFVPMLN